MRDRLNRLLLVVVAAVLALVFAALITALVLELTHHNAWTTLRQMVDYGTQADQLAGILNQGSTYYLSAIAVAIGFRMNLFNIGVDGQYQLAALLRPRSAASSTCRTASTRSPSSSSPCSSARSGPASPAC